MEDDKQLSDGETVLNPAGDQSPNDQNPGGQNPSGKSESDHHGSVVPSNVLNDLFSRYGDAYFDMFPPGYRFKPYDDELVVHYLKRKIMKMQLPPNRIREVELYKSNPHDLAASYSSNGDKEWYFFTPRDRKYKNGERPNRAAGDGYWKATGADRPVKSNGVVVGSRKALVFYRGKPPRGDKTNWIMHEFRAENPVRRKKGGGNDMRLDDWVLCRLYKKVDRNNKGSARPRDTAVPDQEQENKIPPTFQDPGHLPMDGSKMLPQENFLPEVLESLDQLYGYYNSANQMGMNTFDNAKYLHGSQSSFPGVPQLEQNPMVHNIISGYQNPNLMMPESFTSTENHIKPEHYNDYQSDELLNFPPEANGLDQIVSTFRGPSSCVFTPSFTDDRGASSCHSSTFK